MTVETEREEIHHRQIDLRFYKRSDGLYEVEGRLLDTKTQPFRRRLADSDTPPGTPLHDIVVRMVIDDSMLVQDVQASMPATPFAVCAGASETLAPLRGLSIGAGWNKRVRDLLSGAASCTHIMEMLGPMATTAFQGLAPQRLARMNTHGSDSERAGKVNSCYAYSDQREVVARLWPHLSRPTPLE